MNIRHLLKLARTTNVPSVTPRIVNAVMKKESGSTSEQTQRVDVSKLNSKKLIEMIYPLPQFDRTLTMGNLIETTVLEPESTSNLTPALSTPVGPRSLEEYRAYIENKYPKHFARLKQKANLTAQQQRHAVAEACWRILELPANHPLGGNFQVIAPTGAGKTYVLRELINICRAEAPDRFPLNKFWLILSPPTVVTQTTNVFSQTGTYPGCIITSLASLRKGMASNMFIEWKTVIVNNEPTIYPFYRTEMLCAVIVDESQQLKNDSTQSLMIESAANHRLLTIPISATPYSRPCQARTIACALRPVVQLGPRKVNVILDDKIWPTWINEICAPYSPLDWRPSRLAELQRWLESKTVRFTCQYEHPIYTSYVACRFATLEDRQDYNQAYKEWQDLKAKQGRGETDSINVLVAMQKFNQKADNISAKYRAAWLAKDLRYRAANPRLKQYSYILGFAFRTAADICYRELIETHGFSEKEIGRILGGRGAANNKDHNLFQRDKIQILVMTVQCGGAGLSLDQNRQNKRQRIMLASSVYNDIQMAQLAGRTQRTDTQSASWLKILYFEGTEEVRKINKVRRKVRSLSQITTRVSVEQAVKGAANSFVDDQELISDTSVHGSALLNGDAEMDEVERDESEKMLAAHVLGTAQQLEYEVVTEEEDKE